eukprot:SAG31_NODE_6947_length_1840_cov_1.595635_2_plen_95_part_00
MTTKKSLQQAECKVQLLQRRQQAAKSSAPGVQFKLIRMAMLVRATAGGVQPGLQLYPAAPMNATGQAYWNTSLNSWGGSVYNDSVRQILQICKH